MGHFLAPVCLSIRSEGAKHINIFYDMSGEIIPFSVTFLASPSGSLVWSSLIFPSPPPGKLRGSAVRTQQSVPAPAGPVPLIERLPAAALSQLPQPEDAGPAGAGPVPTWHAYGPVLQGVCFQICIVLMSLILH